MGTNHISATPAKGVRKERLVSVARACSAWSLDRLLLSPDFEAQVFFSEPEGSRQILGLGIAHLLEGHYSTRFEDIAKGSMALFANALMEGPGRGPQLVGGFAFTPDYLSDRVWQNFLPACFILPHFQLEREGESSLLRINVWAENDEDAEQVKVACGKALDLFVETYLSAQGQEPALSPGPKEECRKYEVTEPVTESDWTETVQKALALIELQQVRKIVLARIRELKCQHGFNIPTALQALLCTYADCFTFLFRPGKGTAFLGASPELLCKTEKGSLELAALAGTALRLRNKKQDQRKKEDLLNSTKNQREHQFVVDSIVEVVRSQGGTIEVPLGPQILSLNNVHHLYTPLFGTSLPFENALEWASLLHPTPALGGEPRDVAIQWIDALESQPRGWYGAPFGVVDSKFNGTFTVAIRSAVVSGSRAWLFAGAGIVAGSRPCIEWSETAWKFQPMQEALTSWRPQ